MKPLLQSVVGGSFALAVLLAPSASEAADLRLTLGADYHLNDGALFGLTGAVDFHMTGPLYLGPRVGFLVSTRENGLGLPLDLNLRVSPRNTPVYLDLLLGPWIFLQGDSLRAHAGVGFGYQGRSFGIGLEVGYLEPSPIIGLHAGWRF